MLPAWHRELLEALTSAAYAPADMVTRSSGLDWLGRVTRRYRHMYGEPILDSIEAMVEIFQGN